MCVCVCDIISLCRLLKLWRPITLDVALELLDYHYADERVRSLAVRRLEKLSNEELMLFLLQLTQVCECVCVCVCSCVCACVCDYVGGEGRNICLCPSL